MTCKGTSGRLRRACLAWETIQRAQCLNWFTEWTRRCTEWETLWEQQCTSWRTEWEERCDSWEEVQTEECSDWFFLLKWICLGWTWVTTTVCRVWTWVSSTVCDAFTWVSTTLCRAWTWVGVVICAAWVIITVLVCRLSVLILDTWCLLSCAFKALFAPNEFSESKSECIYGWTSAYRADFDPDKCLLLITLRIRLVPGSGVSATELSAARATWEAAIEAEWSGQFPLVRRSGTCSCEQVTVQVDVRFVQSGEHHRVEVADGQGRSDMTHWFIEDDGDTAAHEAGHMLGNPDEYEDENCPNRDVTSDGSIMQDSAASVKARHYGSFARWLSNRTCCDYEARA